jgi:hypothetical protein
LHQIPFAEELSESPVMPCVDQNEGEENGNNDEIEEEEEIDEEEQQHFRTRPSFQNPEEDIDHDEEDEEVEQRPENVRVNRFRGTKHVPVYALSMGENKQISEISTNKQDQNIDHSIINCKDYSKKHNYSVQLFRAEGKNVFYARKRALTAHKLICKEAFCEICNLSKFFASRIHLAYC